jgi:conjugal transfer mating pair stabilization protein TraN
MVGKNVYLLLTSLTLLLSQLTFADNPNFNQAYQEGSQLGNQLMPNTEQAVKSFNPQNIFQNYIPNPAQSQYYQGEKQSSSDLSARGAQEALTNPQGQAVIQSFSEHPLYTIDKNEQGMQRSQLITHDAANIVNGISDQFVDCKKTQECHTEYTSQTCSESGGLGNAECTKDLSVNAIPAPPISKTITVTAQGSQWSFISSSITYTVDLRTGQLISASSKGAKANVSPRLDGIPCHELRVTYSVSPISSWGVKPTVQMSALPSCGNNFQTTFTIRGKGWFISNLGARITFQLIGKDADTLSEHWTSNCDLLEQKAAQGICSRTSADICTSPSGTRVINGIPITRDCWQKTSKFNCSHGQAANDCQQWRDKGCEQIGSVCTNKIGNDCFVYQQTYRCPTQKCAGGIGIICGDNTFCLEGNCTNPQKTQSQDFEKSVSALSATADASKQFDRNFIFRGQPKDCRSDIGGFRDCCADPGWGQKMHLAGCHESEKILGHDKEVKLTIYVGEYCAHRVMGVCVEHKKAYCTFQSKLARIIQQQGRLGQLGIGFGDGENPNCQGLTPEQLQRIDFSRIDFTEFYDDLKQKMKLPDTGATNERIKEAIKRQYDQGKSHG